MKESLLNEKKELESRLIEIQSELSKIKSNDFKSILIEYINSEDNDIKRKIFDLLDAEYNTHHEEVMDRLGDSVSFDDACDTASYEAKSKMTELYGIEWDGYRDTLETITKDYVNTILKRMNQLENVGGPVEIGDDGVPVDNEDVHRMWRLGKIESAIEHLCETVNCSGIINYGAIGDISIWNPIKSQDEMREIIIKELEKVNFYYYRITEVYHKDGSFLSYKLYYHPIQEERLRKINGDYNPNRGWEVSEEYELSRLARVGYKPDPDSGFYVKVYEK